MSSTLLRLGSWIIVLVMALYVLHETLEQSPFHDYVTLDMLTKAVGVGVLLTIAGVIVLIVEKGAKKVVHKNRCVVCKTPVGPGQIYCRQHLRRVLEVEDQKTHMTRTRH